MPRRAIPLIAEHYYHIYNRGHNREPIFLESDNYRFFLHRVREYLIPHTALLAYVLMPNHYHLIIKAQTDRVSHAMQLLGISYTKAVNTRHQRTGALFQGAFQAKEIDCDEYLVPLSRYLHLNPVRAGLVARPEDWQFSSYLTYIGLRPDSLVSVSEVLAQFHAGDDTNPRQTSLRYRAFVEGYAVEDRQRIAHLL